jgi:MFS family permease
MTEIEDPDSDARTGAGPLQAGLNPGSRSVIPRGHPVSWVTLVITTLAILMTSVDAGILPAVLPAIKEEFGLTNGQAGFVNSVFFFGTLVGALGFGWLSDRIGTGYRRTWTWNIAMLIGIIGGALTWGFAGSFVAFLLLRIPMGFSRGGSEPVNVALVSEWWPKEHRGFAVGVHHTGFPLGQFLTGALISLVLGMAGWKEAFLIIPMIGIPIIIAQTVVGTRRNQQRVYDWIDAKNLTRPLPELTTSTRSGLEPIKAAVKNKNVWLSMILMFLFLWCEAGASTFLTTQLVDHHVSQSQAALIAGASGLTGWIGQVAWGTWSDRAGRKFAMRFLIIGWTLALLGMILISGATSGWLVLLFWGLFRNAPFPVAYALLIDSLPKYAGSAMGLMIGLAFALSGLLATPVAGWIIDTWGFTASYLVLAAICLIGFLPLRWITESVRVHTKGAEASA